MDHRPTASLIGAGRIGSALLRRLHEDEWDVEFVAKSSGIYKGNGGHAWELEQKDDLENLINHLVRTEIVFIAIPTKDDGRQEYQYIRELTEAGVRVVTCAKGAMANYFKKLSEIYDIIGYNATVGGGARLLSTLADSDTQNIEEIQLVANATLNYMFNFPKRSWKDTVMEAQEQGYTEPHAKTPLQIVQNELRDCAFKAAITFNVAEVSDMILREKDISIQKVSEGDIDKFQKENRRYVIKISREDSDVPPGGFSHKLGAWHITGGFRELTRCVDVVPWGYYNSIKIVEKGKQFYTSSGPGAGPGPTVRSMMIDAYQNLPTRIM